MLRIRTSTQSAFHLPPFTSLHTACLTAGHTRTQHAHTNTSLHLRSNLSQLHPLYLSLPFKTQRHASASCGSDKKKEEEAATPTSATDEELDSKFNLPLV